MSLPISNLVLDPSFTPDNANFNVRVLRQWSDEVLPNLTAGFQALTQYQFEDYFPRGDSEDMYLANLNQLQRWARLVEKERSITPVLWIDKILDEDVYRLNTGRIMGWGAQVKAS